MAVREYIGARYVPIIYENSLNPASADWEAGVHYEPLTIVTYNYSAYTSKKDVPNSVGDPASNPTYWAETGVYNGQIANLQNQIGSLGNLQTSDTSNLVSAINEVNDNSYQEVLASVTGDGTITYGGALDQLGVILDPLVNAMTWENRRRLCCDTRFGNFRISAIGISPFILEFYGTHLIRDDESWWTTFAFKIGPTGTSQVKRIIHNFGSDHYVPVIEVPANSGNLRADIKIEGWANATLQPGEIISVMLV